VVNILRRIFFSTWLGLLSAMASASTPQVVNQLLSNGDYETALSEVETGLNNNPNNLRLMLQKGFILIRLRRLDEAEEYYLELIKRLPENPEPLNNLGVIYQLQKKYDKAITIFNDTITRFPEFSRAYENLGDTYIQVATQTYSKGREMTPDDEMLIAKAELGQSFYRLANEARDSASSVTVSFESKQKNEEDSPNSQSEQKSVDDLDTEILEFLKSWTTDWSTKNIEAYFEHYAEEFSPEDSLDLAAWKKRRTAIIDAAEYIRIRIEAIKILQINDNQIAVSFTQHYESNSLQDKVKKTLTLKRYNERWRIINES
jgi:tetratricopeptide (TPR) repeat protein